MVSGFEAKSVDEFIPVGGRWNVPAGWTKATSVGSRSEVVEAAVVIEQFCIVSLNALGALLGSCPCRAVGDFRDDASVGVLMGPKVIREPTLFSNGHQTVLVAVMRHRGAAVAGSRGGSR